MQTYTITDDFGRRTTFTAVQLACETTDQPDGRKPQYTDLTIWRTEAGKYVVQRDVHYRIRHRDDSCERAALQGAELREATDADTFPCHTCAPDETGGLGQETRTSLTVYTTAEELIAGLATINHQTGGSHHSQFAQAILADLSDQDDAVDAAWMEQVIA